jgi:hypothetical protein
MSPFLRKSGRRRRVRNGCDDPPLIRAVVPIASVTGGWLSKTATRSAAEVARGDCIFGACSISSILDGKVHETMPKKSSRGRERLIKRMRGFSATLPPRAIVILSS